MQEMLTGTHPFKASTAAETLSAILNAPASSPHKWENKIPRKVLSLLDSLLEKDSGRRPAMFVALGELQLAQAGHLRGGASLTSRPVAAVVVLLIATLSGLFLWNLRSQRQADAARSRFPEIVELANSRDFVAAFELFETVRTVLGDDLGLEQVIPQFADEIFVRTAPPGASVTLYRLGETSQEPIDLGFTPVEDYLVARAQYRVVIEKEGFATLERPVSSERNRQYSFVGSDPAIHIDEELHPSEQVPDGTTLVEGGLYSLVGAGLQNAKAVQLDDFLMDRYEVSNGAFKAFIDAGGYREPSIWNENDDLVRDSFQAAEFGLVDRTGLPGPSTWTGQVFRQGTENHPVTGVSWLEAMAFCRFHEKVLPTVYQWEMAG